MNLTQAQQEAIDALKKYGSERKAAEALGVTRNAIRDRVKHAKKKQEAGSGVAEAMQRLGVSVSALRGGWIKDEGASLRFDLPKEEIDQKTVLEEIRDTIDEIMFGKKPKLPDRFEQREGSLLFLSPADVHIGKLSVQSETGVVYNTDIAAHRLSQGCAQLVRRAKAVNCTSVAFIIGNDISHIDKPNGQTTSGTDQDTCGTIFTMHKAALKGYVGAIENALSEGLTVYLYFVPSNHDWVLGYTIAQAVWAWFRNHPNVHANEYTMSENHRKYLRFGSNNLGITHGDGAKEKDLPQLMMRETGRHAAETLHHYWYIHHLHHKIKKSIGLSDLSREKDHISMTTIQMGVPSMEGDNMQMEVIRSPSAPDGWHHRNGYLNRQAVEAFVHHAQDGQTDRFTEWF